jgi:uncharacterized protein
LALTSWIPGLKSETWGTLRLFILARLGDGLSGFYEGKGPSPVHSELLGDDVLIPVSDHPLGATFAIRVQPRAARTAITGTVGDRLKLSLSAPPLDGRANLAVVEFFSEIFSVPRSTVQVVAGERSRNKVIRIAGRTGAEVQRMLREHFTV